MAFICKIGLKTECDACGYCQKDPEYCPVCGSEDWEYLCKQENEVIGCSECIRRIWRD